MKKTTMRFHPLCCHWTLWTLLLVQNGQSFIPYPTKCHKLSRVLDTLSGGTPDINKADLYSKEDLQRLLDIHETLSASEPGFLGNSGPHLNATPSLHDLVLDTIETVESAQQQASIEQPSRLRFESHFDPDQVATIIPRIRAVVSDVDGTLLTSEHTLHPRTASAVKEAIECAFSPVHPLCYFFPATGKTRAGALRSLGPDIKALLEQTPGVFCQGLYCLDANGTVVYEQRLDASAIPKAEDLAKEYEMVILGYDGDLILAGNWTSANYIKQVTDRFGEPMPKIVKTLLQSHQPGFHKMLFLHEDADFLVKEFRPKLEALAAELECEVTQAVPSMLELLPKNCSKLVGVQKLCEHLGIDLSQEVCAIGDAENDMGLLKQSALGIAVGNANQNVKDIADVVLTSTNDEGAAGVAIQLFGLGKVVDADISD